MQGMTVLMRALLALLTGLALVVGGTACAELSAGIGGDAVSTSYAPIVDPAGDAGGDPAGDVGPQPSGEEGEWGPAWFEDDAGAVNDPGAAAAAAAADDDDDADTGSVPAGIPPHVLDTLALIDSGDWPDAAGAPGTRGGERFGNREQLLPKTAENGQRISYQEWDVNPKERGRGRDAERIVTGSDGSAWYTADHYASFARIR